MEYKTGFDFKGKVAIVTGGGQGIGKEIAKAFASCGASVAILQRRLDAAQAAAADLDGGMEKHFACSCDLSDLKSIEDAVNAVENRFGKIDFLVNNAGAVLRKEIVDYTQEDWDKICNLNLRGTIFISQMAGKVMIKNNFGRIVNITSTSGFINRPDVLGYSATKAGLSHATRTFAHAWAPYNITANCVSPGFVMTDMITDYDKDWMAKNTERVPP